jgi:hypothetical protein
VELHNLATGHRSRGYFGVSPYLRWKLKGSPMHDPYARNAMWREGAECRVLLPMCRAGHPAK